MKITTHHTKLLALLFVPSVLCSPTPTTAAEVAQGAVTATAVNNSTVQAPSRSMACDAHGYTVTLFTFEQPTFSKADAIQFSTVDLPVAIRNYRPRVGSDPWKVHLPNNFVFFIDNYYVIDAVAACVEFFINVDYGEDERVFSSSYMVDKGTGYSRRHAGGYFGGQEYAAAS